MVASIRSPRSWRCRSRRRCARTSSSRSRRATPRHARSVRLVQPRNAAYPRRLSQWRAVDPVAHRPRHAGLSLPADRARMGIRAAAGRLPAGGRPGLYHDRRADAAGSLVQPDGRRGAAGRELSGQPQRGRVGHVPHRLQLPRPGAEHRAGVRHVEGLVGARSQGLAKAIVEDANRTLASIKDAKISALEPPPIDNLGNSSRLQLPAAGSRTAGLRRADAGEGPVDRGGQQEPGPAGRLCRGPAARRPGATRRSTARRPRPSA